MKVKVNKYDFDIEVGHDLITVNGKAIKLDSIPLSASYSHVIYNHRSFNIEVAAENKADKTFQIKVNNRNYDIVIEDQYDLLLKQLGMDNARASEVKEIKAPMPGLVLDVIACEADAVSKGDNLLVLEAMKMENIIKSPSDGIIKKILISKGDKVEKNEILIQFE